MKLKLKISLFVAIAFLTECLLIDNVKSEDYIFDNIENNIENNINNEEEKEEDYTDNIIDTEILEELESNLESSEKVTLSDTVYLNSTYFPDKNLRQAIIDSVKSYQSITLREGANITSNIPKIKYLILTGDYGITDFTGLEYFTSLEGLQLQGFKNFSSLPEKIGELTTLKEIVLWNNTFTNIDVIKNLENLEYITLTDNSISSLKAIRTLKNVKIVHFSTGSVDDIFNLPRTEEPYYLSIKSGNIDLNEYTNKFSFYKTNSSSTEVTGYAGNKFTVYGNSGELKTDWNSSNGYVYTYVKSNTIPIKIEEVIIEDKEYDGTNTAKIKSVKFLNDEGEVEELELGEDFTGVATFIDSTVGNGKQVNVSIELLDDRYVPFWSLDVTEATTTGNITKANLEVTTEVESKIYDGTDVAELKNFSISGFIDGEELIEGIDYIVTATFEDEKVGKDKEVTVKVTLLDTDKANNYSLERDEIKLTADIEKIPLDFTVEVSNKPFDNTTDAEVTSFEIIGDLFDDYPLIEGVDYTVTATFEDEKVGKDKKVTVTVELNNTETASIYTFGEVSKYYTADITKLILDFTAEVSNKPFDNTTDGTVTSVTFSGLLGGISYEDILVSEEYEETEEEIKEEDRTSYTVLNFGEDYTVTAFFDTERPGEEKTVYVTVELIENDKTAMYELSEDTIEVLANIERLPISFTATALDKFYDGNTDAEIVDVEFYGLFVEEEEAETEEAEDIEETEKYKTKYSEEVEETEEVEEIIDYTNLVLGKDYEVTGYFENEKVGKDKNVTVTVKLLETEKTDIYYLEEESIIVTADIIEEPTTGIIEPGNGVVIFPIGEEEKESIFEDLFNHWAKDYIYDLYEKGIVSGYTDGTFKPDIETSRADVAVLVCNLLKYLEFDTSNINLEDRNYSDVLTSKYYYDEVQLANQLDIMVGYGDDTFKPSNNITREEFVMVLYKLISKGYIVVEKREGREFTDYEDVSFWCKEAFDYINNLGLLTGYEDGTFSPQSNLTRAELVTLLYKILN